MRISDWSSDVCSSDLWIAERHYRSQCRHDIDDGGRLRPDLRIHESRRGLSWNGGGDLPARRPLCLRGLATELCGAGALDAWHWPYGGCAIHTVSRSEEHTSERQPLLLISYAVFCL